MAGFGKVNQVKNNKKTGNTGPQLLNAAVTAHRQGDTKTAEHLYKKVIEKGNLHEIAFSNLGVIYKNSGRYEDAIKSYERAININPTLADAHINLGNAHKELGNLQQALESTLTALTLSPNNPDAHTNLACISRELGNLDQALKSTFASLRLKPDNPELLNNALSLYENSMLREIKSFLIKAKTKNCRIMNDLNYIEAVSSMGEDFTSNIIAGKNLSN